MAMSGCIVVFTTVALFPFCNQIFKQWLLGKWHGNGSCQMAANVLEDDHVRNASNVGGKSWNKFNKRCIVRCLFGLQVSFRQLGKPKVHFDHWLLVCSNFYERRLAVTAWQRIQVCWGVSVSQLWICVLPPTQTNHGKDIKVVLFVCICACGYFSIFWGRYVKKAS